MNNCVYCDTVIKTIRVSCSHCTGIDLCVQCFSLGAELGSHKNTHPYTVIDTGTFPIFDDNWKAIEELQLLEGVEQFGLGSWKDASEFVEARTPNEVKIHYTKYYVEGNLGNLTWNHKGAPYKVHDHTCPNNAPLSPSLTTPLPAIKELTPREQSLLGYLPKRDDFEREDDNEAEKLVSTLAVTSQTDQDELERALKLAHIDMYARRLEERGRKKRVAREYSLVQLFLEQWNTVNPEDSPDMIAPSSILTPPCTQEQDGSNNQTLALANSSLGESYKEKLRVFGQFHSAQDHLELVGSLVRERDLRSQIKRRLRTPADNKKKSKNGSSALKSSISSPKRSSISPPPHSKRGKLSSSKSSTTSIAETTKCKNGKKILEDFDIESMPSCRLLSKNEKDLCKRIRLRPSQYLTLKTIIIKNRRMKKQKNIENMDRSIVRRVTNFMVKARLLKPQSCA